MRPGTRRTAAVYDNAITVKVNTLLGRSVRLSVQEKPAGPLAAVRTVTGKDQFPRASIVAVAVKTVADRASTTRQAAVALGVNPEPVAVNVVVTVPSRGLTVTCGATTGVVEVVVVGAEVVDVVTRIEEVVELAAVVVVELAAEDEVVELPALVVVELPTDEVVDGPEGVEVVEGPDGVVVVDGPGGVDVVEGLDGVDVVDGLDGVEVVAGLVSAVSAIEPSGEAPPQVLIWSPPAQVIACAVIGPE
jgi:hypothetical protein